MKIRIDTMVLSDSAIECHRSGYISIGHRRGDILRFDGAFCISDHRFAVIICIAKRSKYL